MKMINSSRVLLLWLFMAMSMNGIAAENGKHWVATWGESPFGFLAFGNVPAPAPLVDQTLRQKLRISVGGEQVRIRFSNELGTAPLVIGSATVAIADKESAIMPASLRTLTFSGQKGIMIPAGAPALSDPVDLKVGDLAELAISIYLPQSSKPESMHMGRTAYVTTAGDFTQAAKLEAATLGTNHFFLSGVYVNTTDKVSVVATFGDSITDGTASTPHAYASWPDDLAARFSKGINGRKLAVINEGIAGNQVLLDGAGVSALARFDRDVLSTPGLTHIVVLEGINDIGTGGRAMPGSTAPVQAERTPAELINGYRQLIARAHANGIRIIGATLTPFAGTLGGYYTPAKDEVRVAINKWIREGGEFDGVIDFDAAVRDETNSREMKKDYNSGDKLHPGDAGYRKMAESVDPALFR